MKLPHSMCLLAGCVAVTTAVTWQVFSPATPSVDQTPAVTVTTAHERAEQVDEVVDQEALRGAVALLRAELGSVSSEMTNLRQRLRTLEEATNEAPVSNLARQAYAGPRQADDIGAQIEALESALDEQAQDADVAALDRMDRVEVAFRAEVATSQWPLRTSERIEALLESNEFAGSEIVDIECRETLCRLEVEHDSVATEDAFSSIFPQRVMALTPRILLRMASADGHPSSLAYLARAGHRLP